MSNLTDFGIDWSKVETVDYSVIPKGTYAAKMVKSTIKDTKDGKGKYVAATFELLGAYKNRKIFENFTLMNKNPKAIEIGLGKLKSIAEAVEVNFDELQDTSDLHGKPMGIKVDVKTSEQYGEQNRITSFLTYEEDMLKSDTELNTLSVDDVVEEDTVVEDTLSTTPEEIKAMKKDELLKFISAEGLELDMNGKKVSEIKLMAIDAIFNPVSEGEDEDIIIED